MHDDAPDRVARRKNLQIDAKVLELGKRTSRKAPRNGRSVEHIQTIAEE
jgi:hypothetical protein